MTIRIPLAKPEINDTDREAVMSILRTPHLSMGPKVEELERAMCDYTGSAHAVAVNSGTSALQLAIRALEIERGAEVMLPSFTFSAVLNVVLPEGLRPRLVDIDPAAYNCTAEAVQAAVTPETQLIVAVHTFGFPVDVIAMQQAARALSAGRERPIHVIEDACEALGADVHGQKAGMVADAGLFASIRISRSQLAKAGCFSLRTTSSLARLFSCAIRVAIHHSAGTRMRTSGPAITWRTSIARWEFRSWRELKTPLRNARELRNPTVNWRAFPRLFVLRSQAMLGGSAGLSIRCSSHRSSRPGIVIGYAKRCCTRELRQDDTSHRYIGNR
jgi:hypothetical protein